MKHKLTQTEGHAQSSVVAYEYRGMTITGTSNASSSSPYTRSRKWVIGNGLRASSLADAKSRIDRIADSQHVTP